MRLRCFSMMAAMFLVTQGALPAEGMRCGGRIVSSGDPKAKVADLCGDPDSKERRTVYRAGLPRGRTLDDIEHRDTSTDRELLIHDRSVVEVVVDVWVYNPGKRRLMREVVFEDNRVVEINALGRGY